jgi:predicted MFS family arabinose efflux permease
LSLAASNATLLASTAEPFMIRPEVRSGAPAAHEPSQAHAAASGLVCLLIGLGFSRFGYPPLIPALVQQGWFTAPEAAYLGAANLAGYLLGSALGPPLARRVSGTTLIRASLVVCTAALVACAANWGFAWYFAWRLLSGVGGAWLMVLAAPKVVSFAPAGHRGRVAGIVFTGVGIAIVLTGTLVPWLVSIGIAETWLAFGAASVVLTIVAWNGLPSAGERTAERMPDAAATAKPSAAQTVANIATPGPRERTFTPAIVILGITYSAYALGFVPHTVFWVDFIARGLGRGLAEGGAYWVLLGLMACVAPVLTGSIADRIGFGLSYRLSLAAIAVFVGAPLVSTEAWSLALSSAGVGALSITVSSLALGRTGELASAGRQRQVWGAITIAFSIAYAGGGYLLSFLFARTGDYTLLFAIGTAALAFAFVLDWAAALWEARAKVERASGEV